MSVTRRHSPPSSAFLGDIARFPHWDSYEAPLRRDGLAMLELHLALFAHHPHGFKQLLLLRDRIVAPFGLRPSGAGAAAEIKPAYSIGEKILRFTLFGQNDDEIVTGGDDKHLDFRVSVRKLGEGGAARVVVTTVVSPHGLFGKVYLSAILPFHRFGIRTLLANAVKAGRL